MTSAEAALESTGQLLLQLFTLCNGYHSSTIQKITICSSFFQIGRSVILQDIETKLWIKRESPLSFGQSLIETLKRIPIYVSNIIFRIGSLAVAMSYLRLYSIIPISILLLELGWISWNRIRKLSNKERAIILVPQLMASNLGVLNSYAFDQGCGSGYGKEDEKEEDIKKFVIRSTWITFFHHSIVLAIIMVIGYFQPEFFVSSLRFTPTKGWFFSLVGFLLGMGVLSLTITMCYVFWSELICICARKSARRGLQLP